MRSPFLIAALFGASLAACSSAEPAIVPEEPEIEPAPQRRSKRKPDPLHETNWTDNCGGARARRRLMQRGKSV